MVFTPRTSRFTGWFSRKAQSDDKDESRHAQQPKWSMGIMNDPWTTEVPGKTSSPE